MPEQIELDEVVWVEVADIETPMSTDRFDDNVVEVTAATARLLQRAIGVVALGLRPDLEALGASKATVKIGAKLTMKAGKLAALISEVGAEGTVEVTIEFTGRP